MQNLDLSPVHANSIKTPKATVGYVLVDRKGNVLKFGQTTLGTRRYSLSYFERIGARMRILTEKMSKEAAKSWERYKIEQYEKEHGIKPPMNKGYN